MLSDFYLPYFGGVEQHVRSLSHELVLRGHEVAVATLWREGLAEFEVDQGVRIHRIRGTMQRIRLLFSDPERRWTPPFPDPELTWALARLVGEERPDVVHGHDWLVRSFLPLKAWSGAKLIVSLHYYTLLCAKKTLVYRGAPCEGPAFRKCLDCVGGHYGRAKGAAIVLANQAMSMAERAAVDLFLPVSRDAADGNGLTDGNLPFQVIPNFVPDDVSVPRGELGPYLAQLPGEDYLLFVGVLQSYKGSDVLLEAYADLPNAPPLVVITPTVPDIPTAISPSVTILENWPHAAVMAAWRRSLAALVPSVCRDACATVVLEAMASARPVIASRIGGMPDLVKDGETGLLVPPGDPVALRRAIQRLLADPALRKRMGRAGKQRVVDFQTSTVVPRIEEVYATVLRQPRSRGGAVDTVAS
jgi:glycosyltransferase involved in cell wall biosynthesis